MKWKSIETAPKDGQEILVCNVRQGGVKQLISYNIIHDYWQSKGKPDLPFDWTHWTLIPLTPLNLEKKPC